MAQPYRSRRSIVGIFLGTECRLTSGDNGGGGAARRTRGGGR